MSRETPDLTIYFYTRRPEVERQALEAEVALLRSIIRDLAPGDQGWGVLIRSEVRLSAEQWAAVDRARNEETT